MDLHSARPQRSKTLRKRKRKGNEDEDDDDDDAEDNDENGKWFIEMAILDCIQGLHFDGSEDTLPLSLFPSLSLTLACIALRSLSVPPHALTILALFL